MVKTVLRLEIREMNDRLEKKRERLDAELKPHAIPRSIIYALPHPTASILLTPKYASTPPTHRTKKTQHAQTSTKPEVPAAPPMATAPVEIPPVAQAFRWAAHV
jgi:hypothetical protein